MTKRDAQTALIAKLYRHAGDVHREIMRAGGGFDGDREAWHIVFAGLEYLFGSKPEIWLPAGEGRKRVVKAYAAIVGGADGGDASELAGNIEWAIEESRGDSISGREKQRRAKKDSHATQEIAEPATGDPPVSKRLTGAKSRKKRKESAAE